MISSLVTGLSPLAPTWLHLHDVVGGTYDNPTSIVVSDSVSGHWTPGSQILITSHTRVWNEGQERTIVGVRPSITPGFVELSLNSPILRPTTWIEFPDFAVEVAVRPMSSVFNLFLKLWSSSCRGMSYSMPKKVSWEGTWKYE